MEVHHHSHHPKKWKEYATEFIMLFAAVTLGFFAENSVDEIEELQHLTEDLLMNYREKMAVMFRGVVFKQMYTNPTGVQSDKFTRPTNNPSLISNNPTDINELLIKALYVHNNTINILEKSKKIRREALDLDNILINQYHLK